MRSPIATAFALIRNERRINALTVAALLIVAAVVAARGEVVPTAMLGIAALVVPSVGAWMRAVAHG